MKPDILLISFGSLSLLFSAFPSSAANGIETLVVIGRATSETMLADNLQTLDAQTLMPGARVDSAEWLQGIAGLQVDSRSNYAQDTRITLRGFGARSAFGVRGLDLQVDGIPLTMPDGQGQFSGVLLGDVQSTQVLSGPLASLYGNAAGGVVSLRTRAPQQDRLSVTNAFDGDGLERWQLAGEWQQDNLGMRLQASTLDADSVRPHSAAQREQYASQVYWQFDNGVQLQWRFDKEHDPLLQDPLGLTPGQWLQDPFQNNPSAEFFNTRKTLDQQQNAISLRQTEGEHHWQAAVWQGQRDLEQYLAQKGDAIANSGGVVNLARDYSGANANYTWDFALMGTAADFTLGGEWSTMDDRRKGFINDAGIAGDLRRNELGQVDGRDAYAILQWQPIRRWQWLAGVRHSRIDFTINDYFMVPGNGDDSGSKTFSHHSAALSTVYQLDGQWSLSAGVGTGFETPTLTESAYTSGDRGFNQTLDAAHNRQQEMGVTYQTAGTTLKLTGFHINTANEIVVDQSQNGRTSYRNAAATVRNGVEFSVQQHLANQWSARYSASYLDAHYRAGENNGNLLPGVARLNYYAQLNWQVLPESDVQVSAALVHRSAIAADDAGTTHAPQYTTMDVAVTGNFAWISKGKNANQSGWWIKLANITDKMYVGSVIVNQSNNRAFESAPGRSLSAGLQLVFEKTK